MRARLRLPEILAGLLLSAAPAAAQSLVLFGGGERPEAGVAAFCAAAGGRRARVLVVTWATESPEESFADIRDELVLCRPAAVEHAPSTAALRGGPEPFLARLAAASGVFFSGGDQNRIADALDAWPALREALARRCREGAAFAGTSAGTAIMSETMLTGEGDFSVIDGSTVAVRRGLGLLPGAIVDQHYIRRSRHNRLFGVVLARPELLGIGVDEDHALAIAGVRARSIGPTQAVIVAADPGNPGRLTLELLADGQSYDLAGRRRVP